MSIMNISASQKKKKKSALPKLQLCATVSELTRVQDAAKTG